MASQLICPEGQKGEEVDFAENLMTKNENLGVGAAVMLAL